MYKTMSTLGILLFLSACKQPLNEVNDYFPKVSLVSTIIQTDGSVLVTGHVDAQGAAPLDYLGFSCGINQEPKVNDRQIVLTEYNDTTGNFSATYSGGFNGSLVYYFRVWAANDFGFAYGNILSLSKIMAVPVTPPCTLTANRCNIGGGQADANYFMVSAATPATGTWTISANTSTGPSLNLTFGSALTTGIYTTSANRSVGTGEVYISFNSGTISSFLKAGTKVYVNTVGTKIYTVSICNAPWEYNGGSTYYLNSQFKSPL